MHEPQHVVENLGFFAQSFCSQGSGHVLYRRKNSIAGNGQMATPHARVGGINSC
jgi:hypothetical protein